MNPNMMNLGAHKNTIAITLVILAVLAVVAVVAVVVKRRRKNREGFSLSSIGNAFKNFGQGVASSSVNLYKNVTGSSPPPPPPYVPTYVGRTYDGVEWACPVGTVDTGLDNSRACVSVGAYTSPQWRTADGTNWGWGCPNGTVASDPGVVGSQWEKQCTAGWMGRIAVDGQWQCPEGTTDSGHSWNDPYYTALQQCQRSGPYTVRIPDGKGGWVCPPGTKDTGISWSNPGTNGGWSQCFWTGG